MGRISLLIGRFTDLITFSGSDYNYATFWVLIIIVGVLGYAAFQDGEKVISVTDSSDILSEEE